MLALSLGPSKAVAPAHVHLARAATIQLDVPLLDEVARATPEVETLGELLGEGVVLGELHLGLDGQPSMPFLNPFYYSQEIRGAALISANGQNDAATLATSLMVTARVDF